MQGLYNVEVCYTYICCFAIIAMQYHFSKTFDPCFLVFFWDLMTRSSRETTNGQANKTTPTLYPYMVIMTNACWALALQMASRKKLLS